MYQLLAVTLDEPITWGTMLILLAILALILVVLYFARRT